MYFNCPYCHIESFSPSGTRIIVRNGFFLRKSDGQLIQKYRCKKCRREFSDATLNECVNQKKRHVNWDVFIQLGSAVSLRRCARILNVSRTTMTRKLIFVGTHAREHFNRIAENAEPTVTEMQFDDLETFEHTKMKPLSVTLAVEAGSRRILGFEVSQMPSNGLLAKKSRAKYGRRKDGRKKARAALFEKISGLLRKDVLIKSDMNPHYAPDVKRFFPDATHEVCKGQRGCVTGQGEIKRGGFDPIFSLNHTCAMLRANINRLFRRTWCTTKKRERLELHLAMYAVFHNFFLIK